MILFQRIKRAEHVVRELVRAMETKAHSIDAAKLSSSELQALSSLLYGKTELFESFLARGDGEIASRLAPLLAQLDEPKGKLIMEKLRAVTPTDQSTREPVVITWFLQAIRKHVPPGGLSLPRLLQQPDAAHVLLQATSSDPKLSRACDILLGHILPPLLPSPLAIAHSSLGQVMSKSSSSKDAASTIASSLCHYVSCRLGLELPPHVQLVNCLLGTSPLHLPLASLPGSDDPTLDLSLLTQVVDDLAALDPSLLGQMAQRARMRKQGDLDSILHDLLTTKAASDTTGPIAKLLAIISNLRRLVSFSSHSLSSKEEHTLLPPSASSSNPPFSIIPAIAATTTEDELRSLSDAQRTLLSQEVHKVEAMGKALEGLIPSGIFHTSNFSLTQLLDLPLETRLALAWGLRTEAAASRSAPALISLFYKSSLNRRRKYEDEAKSFGDLLSAFSLEKIVAELDIVSPPRPDVPPGKGADAVLSSHYERYGSEAPVLPTDSELHRHLSSPLDALMDGRVGSETHLAAFNVLVQEGLEGKEEAVAMGALPSSLKEWWWSAKQNMNKLTPRMLALISRFASFQIRVGKKEALEAQLTTRTLLQQVLEEIRRTDRVASARLGKSPMTRASLIQASCPSLMNPLTGSILPIDPDIVSAVLKAEDGPASFKSWLKSNLHDSASSLFSANGESGLQPYDILAEQHLSMDLDRYLQMRNAPELSISFEGLPSSRPEANGFPGEEEAFFLGTCREGLGRYLEARGMPPLTQVEWEAYSQQAMAEFEVTREGYELAMREVKGASNMRDSRDEREHLRAKLASGVKEGSPIYEQARGYLEVLLANPSWNFAQREAVVDRLCELSRHFSDKRVSRASERGSPLAPFFGPTETAAPTIPPLLRK